jgi:hypothetical protein
MEAHVFEVNAIGKSNCVLFEQLNANKSWTNQNIMHKAQLQVEYLKYSGTAIQATLVLSSQNRIFWSHRLSGIGTFALPRVAHDNHWSISKKMKAVPSCPSHPISTLPNIYVTSNIQETLFSHVISQTSTTIK